VEPATVLGRSGRVPVSRGVGQSQEAVADDVGHRQRLQARQAIQTQDRVGHRTLFDAKLATRQGAQLAKLTRWYTPAEILKMATADNAELLALSGLRSPYEGKLGVVEEGALADLLLVDGDPTEDIHLIETPDKSFLAIMKDGVFYKNVTV
jgi:imidazolonepropionase-like amidohydrolase